MKVRGEAKGRRPSLGVEIDRTWTAMYVRVSANKITESHELESGVVADYDSEGKLVGFEIIGLEKTRVGRVLSIVSTRFKDEAPTEDLARLAALVASAHGGRGPLPGQPRHS
jgi:uncharacterized protein YuzE